MNPVYHKLTGFFALSLGINKKDMPNLTPKKYKATKKEPLLVQKADGTIGQWGNPINLPVPVETRRLYPIGSLGADDVSYLQSLKDAKVEAALQNMISAKGETPLYGQTDSDLFKALLAKRKI